MHLGHSPRHCLGRGVRLAATPSDASPQNPRWLQVAYEGQFFYRGQPIAFTRALFERVIENFREHPTYLANPGESNVVRFDYEHASEMDPRLGSVPERGVPAPAWVQELDLRDVDGSAELWALAKLGPTILAQIETDPPEYQWTSVAIDMHWRHPVSGDDMGPTLTSVAFTNDPFLQGMTSIAASMTIQDLLALPPEEAELFLAKARAAISYDQGIKAAPDDAATPSAEITDMTLSKILAATFRVNEHDDTILAAAEEAKAASDAMDTLMGVLGASDFKAALDGAKALVEKTSGMGEIVAQLAAAMERLGQVDAQDAEAEAEAVVTSRVGKMGLSGAAAKIAADELRPAILAMRMAAIGDEGKTAAFRKAYPLPDADRAILTRRVFAGSGGTQLALTHGGESVPLGVAATSYASRPDGRNPERIALSAKCEGRNETEKAVVYLSKENPGFANLDRGEQIHRAGAWLRASN